MEQDGVQGVDINTAAQRGHSTAALRNEITAMYCRHKVFNLPNRKVRAMGAQERRDIESEEVIKYQPLPSLVRPFLPPLSPRFPAVAIRLRMGSNFNQGYVASTGKELDSVLQSVLKLPASLYVQYLVQFNVTNLYQWEHKCWQAPSFKSDPPRSLLHICQNNLSRIITCKYATNDPIRFNRHQCYCDNKTLSAWISGGFVCFIFCNEATC